MIAAYAWGGNAVGGAIPEQQQAGEPPTLGGAPRITQQQPPAKSTLIITTPGSQRFALALSPSRTSPKAVDHTDVQRCRLVVQSPLHTESVARVRPHPATTRAGPAECNLTAKPARKKAVKNLCAPQRTEPNEVPPTSLRCVLATMSRRKMIPLPLPRPPGPSSVRTSALCSPQFSFARSRI